MKKKLIILATLLFGLYGIFQFYLKDKYTDTLHTEINPDDFAPTSSGVEDMINRYVDAYNPPSLSVAIIQNGQVKHFISEGTISKKSETPVDENTIYRIASTGKMLIAIMTQQIVNEGIIKLDGSILKHLGEQISEDKKKELRPITIQNILFHNSGLGRDWKAFSEQDIIDNLNQQNLDFKTGKRWSYSNFGYATLTLILEKASGLSYQDLLTKYIKNKFSIQQLNTTLLEGEQLRYATPYNPEMKFLKGEDKDYGKQTVTSGLYTSVAALTDLMILQIDAYQQADSIKATSPLVLNRNKITAYRQKSFYGNGIFEHQFNIKGSDGLVRTVLEHGGDANGFASAYEFSPDKKNGFVMLTSSGGQWFREMGVNVSKLLGKQSKVN